MARESAKRTILLVRHGEAQKNVQDRHGGQGTSLTEKGVEQCIAAARLILADHRPLRSCDLVAHKIPQVEESAAAIGRVLGIEPRFDERLKGIHLGVVAGLSRAEAAELWPEAARRLEGWRKGTLRIDQLDIPEAEPLEQFRERISSALTDWLTMAGTDVIVAIGTTSSLIMMANIVGLWNEFSYECYHPYDFSPGGITEMVIAGSRPKLVRINATEHLTT